MNLLDNRSLIREFYEFGTTREVIMEAERNMQPIIMSGVMQRANAVNRNGRVYPKHILEREVNKYMEAVREGSAGGELDHPDSSVVSLGNVSHRVIDLWWKDDALYGKVQIVENEVGDKLKGLLKSGFKLGISSRGVGSVKSNNGNDVVQDDFELIAFDFVSSPSTPGAWLFRESNGMTPIQLLPEISALQSIIGRDIWKKIP
jgi:hypothetical protein